MIDDPFDLPVSPPPGAVAISTPNPKTTFELSADQHAARDAIHDWIKNPHGPILTLGGVAGSGKSTVLSVLANELKGPIAFAAYTGKAASVLKKKLREQRAPFDYCGTIHGLIYKPVEGEGGITKFELHTELDKDYRLIVIDEASMLSDDMLEDLRSFDIPILLVGDHAQLPPVGGAGSLIQNPEIVLDKIHRQAEGNPIIRLSARIRETGSFDLSCHDGKAVTFERIMFLDRIVRKRYTAALRTADLAELASIAYTNRRRLTLNLAIRKSLGRTGPPHVDEQVICLRNNRLAGIYNGMRGFVRSVKDRLEGQKWIMPGEVYFPNEDSVKDVKFCVPQFLREKTFSDLNELYEQKIYARNWNDAGHLFDFGYAMTAHKMQGDQAKDVLVLAERPGRFVDDDTWARWQYTAITRASERVTILY